MREREIPELLLRCCGKIYKPTSIKILDGWAKITFFCPICRNWVYLESRNGMKRTVNNIKQDTLNKQFDKQSSFRYIKKGETNGKK